MDRHNTGFPKIQQWGGRQAEGTAGYIKGIGKAPFFVYGPFGKVNYE